jgi:hypothetical protein
LYLLEMNMMIIVVYSVFASAVLSRCFRRYCWAEHSSSSGHLFGFAPASVLPFDSVFRPVKGFGEWVAALYFALGEVATGFARCLRDRARHNDGGADSDSKENRDFNFDSVPRSSALSHCSTKGGVRLWPEAEGSAVQSCESRFRDFGQARVSRGAGRHNLLQAVQQNPSAIAASSTAELFDAFCSTQLLAPCLCAAL